MINSVGAGTISDFVSNVPQSSQSGGVGAVRGGGDPDGDGDGRGGGRVAADSAKISGPAELFSQLQQLQSKDPAKFKQVVSDIADKLKGAADQSSGRESQFLSNLADKFETAAKTGDVSSLQPPQHARHARHPEGTYNQQGQVSPSTGSGVDLKELLATISSEVSRAVGA